MPWFKVDDKLHDHRKARQAGKAAMGVWALAGSWCMDHLTDGFVPESVLIRWGNRRDAARLCTVNLWETATKNGEEGWQFLNWDDFQPSKDEVESERAATRERVRKWREGKRGNGDGNGVTNAPVTPEVRAPRPDPTRPDPSNKSSSTSVEREFAEWYALYPRKKAKADALKAYKAARKKTSAETILSGLRRLLPELNAVAETYRPYPASWLRAESWEDEPSNVHALRTDDQGRPVLPPLPGRSPWGAS